MDLDDLQPRKEEPKPRDLEPMSIEALEDYVVRLEAEIERAKKMIAAKRSVRGAADTFFKK